MLCAHYEQIPYIGEIAFYGLIVTQELGKTKNYRQPNHQIEYWGKFHTSDNLGVHVVISVTLS